MSRVFFTRIRMVSKRFSLILVKHFLEGLLCGLKVWSVLLETACMVSPLVVWFKENFYACWCSFQYGGYWWIGLQALTVINWWGRCFDMVFIVSFWFRSKVFS